MRRCSPRFVATLRTTGLTLFATLAVTAATLASAKDLDQDTKVVRIGAGQTGATDFLFGGLVANAISNPPGTRDCDRGGNCGVPGLIAVAQTTANAAANLRAVAKGEVEMALSQADAAFAAYQGSGVFAGEEPLNNLRILARLYPENVHLIVRKDSPVKSVADLKGKRVGIGMDDAAATATAKLILSAYNIKWRAVQFKFIDLALVTDALNKGGVDALFMVSGAPVLAVEDLARRVPIRLVPINGPAAEKIAQVLPFYSRSVIPANTYGEQPAVETLDVGSVLVTNTNMAPDLAYGIARAIWHERNVGLFQAGHPRGKFMDKNLAARNLGVPIADGADRYYLQNNLMDKSAPVAPLPVSAPTKAPAKAQGASPHTPS